jgi:hypothetical protein
MGTKLLLLTDAIWAMAVYGYVGFVEAKRVSCIGLSPPVGRWARTDPMVLGESIWSRW